MAEEKIFQPGWEETKERQRKRDDGEYHHHHHHHYHSESSRKGFSTALGGAMKQHDKQAYYGLRTIIIGAAIFGLYKLVMLFVVEWRAMPHDDPKTEMNVDELGICKVQEQDAILYGDSIAQELKVDSIKRNLQIDRREPYRPPRREDKWYITQREWKSIWKDYKRQKYERRLEKQERKKKKKTE